MVKTSKVIPKGLDAGPGLVVCKTRQSEQKGS